MSEKLDWKVFKPMFGSWTDRIHPFFNETLDDTYRYLKEESGKGKKIAPLSKDVFKAFEYTNINDICAVVVALCPYHTFVNGKPVASGIPMSCEITDKLQPSLEQYYSALETEFETECIKTPSLKYLCDQGILLLNMSLTVEMGKPKSHNDISLWSPFIAELFSTIIGPSLVPVITLGEVAKECLKWTYPFQPTFSISHPASASYRKEQWNSEGVFKKVSKLVKENEGKDIYWIMEKPPF